MTRILVCVVALLFGVSGQEKEKKYYNSYLGKAPPKMKIDAKKGWINSKDPLTLEALKGKVVWLEFSYTH